MGQVLRAREQPKLAAELVPGWVRGRADWGSVAGRVVKELELEEAGQIREEQD